MSIIFVVGVLVLIILNLFPENSYILLRGADQYNISDIPDKIYILILSFITTISFYNLSNSFKESTFLTNIGQNSIIYYLYHGLIIHFILRPMIRYFNLPQSSPFILLYCCTIICIIYLISKIKFFRWLTAPHL